MTVIPHKHSYKRVRLDGRACTASALNPASHLTDQGGDPRPADLAWCIRRSWRVIYYGYRHAAGQPLREGAEDFEILMADVLFRLSSAFEPIPPIHSRTLRAQAERGPDPRSERILQPSYRIFPAAYLEKHLRL